ncbi:MAG: PD40 domain-containing protein [Chloroflexi bacterium]|nr:PD40 domain-containing protein [Chloroflexota bacterium]
MSLLSKLITGILVLTLLGGIVLVGVLGWLTLNPPPSPLPSIVFTSVEVGDIVTLAVTTRGERVTRAELWAGANMVAREVNPNPALSNPWVVAWQWQPPAPGVYPLVARAYDEAGNYGASALFSVVIPPKQKLLFSSNRDGGHALYEIETATRATGLWQPPASQNRQPAVAPDKRVVFASNQNNAWQLVTRTLDNPTLTILTPNLKTAQRPVWSADGAHIGFEVTDANGATNLVVMDADGKNQRPLTNTDTYDGQASFHPAGDLLAFTARQGNQSDIYTIALANGQLTRLTTDAAQDAMPAWSPDGARIAFVSNRSGIAQIWVMNADGSAAQQLTNIPSGAEQPKWSPDGSWLAFVAYTGAGEGNDRRELYLLYAPAFATKEDERGMIRLTQNDKDDTEPAWTP